MKILAIGAHQDDHEFRVGGCAQKWVKAGHEVRFLSMCNGCGGHHIMTPEETTLRRSRESRKVEEFLGIRYDVWDINDCELMADLDTRNRLIRYIRAFSPDLIITHRANDYHADHRASGQLVQDASYILTVPHTCPDVPAMLRMPTIIYYENTFKHPPFRPDYVIAIDDVIDGKLHIADLNESQVYEWLPYNRGEEVPTDPNERFKWLKGMEIDENTPDEEIMAAKRGYAVQFAKPAVRFRKELIERYGYKKGSKVKYAEAFELCEYGSAPSEELLRELLNL